MPSLLSGSKTLSRSQCRYNSERRQYISRSSTDICFATFLNEICQTFSIIRPGIVNSPLPLHGPVREGWLSIFLGVVISEVRQVVVRISVVRITSCLGKFSDNSRGLTGWYTSLRYSTMSAFFGPSRHCSFHNSAREIFVLVTCNADSRLSTNLSMRADCAAFGVGR